MRMLQHADVGCSGYPLTWLHSHAVRTTPHMPLWSRHLSPKGK